MSEADKMFEEIGYKMDENDNKIMYMYDKICCGERFQHAILFTKISKMVHFYGINGFHMNDLKAVYKKCEEIGWIS